MTVRNLMEEIVGKVLKEMAAAQPELANLDPIHRDDMMAIALNKLPPRYTTTTRGEVIVKSQVRAQLESDVYRELTEAFKIVTKSPR
ncbi:competence protein ComFB [Paenibacillus antri]|uniref:Competence protein ComFB n=1 Tax=Paenibacillus antri TaxID=2582848 RepID=A0A5R9G3H2_9BACL|nr:late competence development ComFB family protein [Paenibacillus antri]TLS50381.1 competence protein ComFB [Paenibacillus antri]